MFGQTFEAYDIIVIGFLILLEGVLSIDNALVLGLLAKRLPKHQQKRALTYGLVGAFVFRIIAILLATILIRLRWLKLVGGGYLIYVAVKQFFFSAPHEHHLPANAENPPNEAKPGNGAGKAFWSTVIAIELTDIAFAVDSILAAVGLVANESKTWVVVIGGLLGVVLMRYAAVVFIKLLDRFPRFETSAYLLVLLIGAKLIIDWVFNTNPKHPAIDFHHPTTLAFWIFWGAMIGCFLLGFVGGKKDPEAEAKREGAGE